MGNGGTGPGSSGAGRDSDAQTAAEGFEVSMPAYLGEFRSRVPAVVGQLSMLRAVAETVLLTADFTLDVVTDVRVALDEVATALILAADSGRQIECEIRYDAHGVDVRVSLVARTETALEDDSFGRHIVAALTDRLETSCGPFDPDLGGYPVVVRFARQRDVDDF
ncbi:ATP-binding protein [Nocardia sp. alder85J]|uniref:ATP-binding protein n=1 Tax=Nocardia sp. alder85J TaxID=2862949 RepID=UPI001CD3C3A2|nr:ATP-binding protein [Nocardia sp. alder85J]MCX4095258.1 ATP-binding protein [Nocardia sp. alder85J]